MKGMWFALTVLILLSSTGAWATPSGAQLEARLSKSPDDPRLRLQVANLYANEKNYTKVIELLNPFTDQLDSQGFLALALAYSEQKDHRNEVRILNMLVEKEETNFRWHMLLAQAFIKQAEATKDPQAKEELLTSGIQTFRKVLKLSPKFKPAFDTLLTTLLKNKNHMEARELLHEGLSQFGDRPEFFRELCRLNAMDGYLPQAVETCRESIRLSPSYPDHYVYLVQTLHDQKEDQAAERYIVAAAKKFPGSEFVQWAAGTLFLKRKNWSVAARYFRSAVKADESSARSQYGLAQALYESGSIEASLDHFIRACKKDPATVETFLQAGSKLKLKGDMNLGGRFVSSANTCRD
ncbi:MAG: tetratricopeptide repeat protein [Bdellovibrionales bacterium]